MTKYSLPVAIALLLALFWISPDTQEIAAGVAIVLIGLLVPAGVTRFGGGYALGGLFRKWPDEPRETGRA